MCVCPHLQALLEAGGLILGVLGDGGVGAAALTGPGLGGAAGVPVLIGGLLHLRAHLHRMLRIRLHQGLSGEQPQVCGRVGEEGRKGDENDRDEE